MPALVRAQGADKPRMTAISQWSAGSDGAAISALGKLFEERGGIWQHNPVPGFTTEMMNKLRAQIMAGDPPAISQLKGPEIAAWSKIAPTVDISPWVKAAGYADKVPAELAKSCQPAGHWIALPLQVYRINTLFMSTKGMERAGVTKPPTTWAEFNETAEKMKAAGMTPLANGGIRWDDGMKFEIALAGIRSGDLSPRASCSSNPTRLKSKEVLAAFEQLRKFANWMNPNIAAQGWAVNLPAFVKGDMGMVLMGGWAQGNLLQAPVRRAADFSSGPAPQESGPPCFDLNADCFIFWKPKGADLEAGQKLFAETRHAAVDAGDVFEDHRLDSGAHRRQSGGRGLYRWPAQLGGESADAIAKDRVVLSLAHNMAQPNGMTAAMIDVLTEYVHNSAIPAAEGQKRLVAAVASAQ